MKQNNKYALIINTCLELTRSKALVKRGVAEVKK